MDIDQYISKSGKEDVWIYGEDQHTGSTVTITSATFQVFDKDGVSVQASASATLSDNGTATPDIYGLVDCTASGSTDGDYYDVLFLITIGSEIYDFTAHIKCGEEQR
jgi:hypothetical protein